MADKPPDGGLCPDEDPCILARGSHVIRGVVRNMVMNMESVLSDLQGIMGDIQSLVVQIDSVTDSIDKHCGAHSDCASLRSTEHCVRKPQCVHGGCSGAVFNPLYAHANSEKLKLEDSGQSKVVPRHNVVQVKAFRRDPPVDSSDPKHREQFRSRSSEIPASVDTGKFIRMSCPSKSFSHFQKEAGMGAPQPGGIAIVYPTIKCDQPAQINKTDSDMPWLEKIDNDSNDKTAASKSFEGRHILGKNYPGNKNNLGNNHHIWLATSIRQNEMKDCIQTVTPQRHRITSVYNKSFQPVTPTEQRSPLISAEFRGKQMQLSPNPERKRASINGRHIPRDMKYSQVVNYPLSDKSFQSLGLYHKYSSIGDSAHKGHQIQRESSPQSHVIIPSSPRMKRSATKAVYNKIHSSSPSSRSPVSLRRHGSEHYYYSIESDLDSEAVLENFDNRSMTPDIDWSYLNLVGNRNIRSNRGVFETIGSDYSYEVPVVSAKLVQPFHSSQAVPGAQSSKPTITVHSPISDRYIRQDSNFVYPAQGIVDKICNSPVIAHVFCSEVSSFQIDGYCGCYEALLDSVLENTSGFESFEEACEDLDNNEVVNETYVSFEDEFEEDDWDMSMKPDDQYEYEFPFFNMHALYMDERRLLDGYQALDDNSNIFAACIDPDSFRDKTFTSESCRRLAVPVSIMERYSDMLNKQRNKRKLSPAMSDNDDDDDYNNDGLHLRGAAGNSFTDEDCCAIKPNVSTQHQNFVLSPKSFVPSDLDLFTETTMNRDVSELDAQMSSSDDTSCQAVGSGSPMSFSSPEAAFTSPETERFVTSSEGDDLLTSQEEAYFYCLDTQGNANVSARRTNMMQLRREFFECLYSVCEKRERENSQDTDSQTLPEENMSCEPSLSRMDNNRDNISESGSYQEEITSYNRNINTWTTYAMVHMQADDISDSTSDIFNDNNISCSLTSSYLDADNIGTAPGNQGLSC